MGFSEKEAYSMAHSDHLKALLRAFAKRDDPAFMIAAHKLIAEEQQKGHTLLSKDMERILSNGTLRPLMYKRLKTLSRDIVAQAIKRGNRSLCVIARSGSNMAV